jgi:hypothetical protein
MKEWMLYNAKLGTATKLTNAEMLKAKKFYKIDFPIWDEYYQRHDENSLRNARGDMFLYAVEEETTTPKQKNLKSGVKNEK